VFVLYVAPFFSENTRFFMEALVRVEGVRVGLISQDPEEFLNEELRHKFAGHWKVQDALSAEQLLWAAEGLAKRHGTIRAILAANEQIQVQVAEVRQHLGVQGMDPETAKNFRDKDRMKAVFEAHGVPCAKHKAATCEQDAWTFIEEVGYPVCVKPIDGAATQSTFRVENADSLRDVLRACGVSATRPLQIEEFIVAKESSFETVTIGGQHCWHSLTHYIPGPLDVVRNPWIQYRVVLPREIDSPRYDLIRKVGTQALTALGIQNGLSHMEWFERADGTVAVNEVAARPPGVQIMPMINRANDIDFFKGWAELMVFGTFTPPKERKYAAGTAFLRGLGEGRVGSVQGLTEVLQNA
jgi:biotin carboxylase